MKGSSRSIAIKKNIIASLFLKGISILVSLHVFPLTINYINPTRYGIWLTLSSIVAWLSYFDLGFAHGFRNRFAEAVAKGDMQLAREYVSTTYVVLSLLFSSVFLIAIVVNHFVDWSAILNVDAAYSSELNIVFGILAFFFCLNIVASIFTTMLTANQKPALASLIQTLGQVFGFICIYILTKTVPGNLDVLAFAFSGVPCFLLIIISIGMFLSGRYRHLSPSFHFVHFSLTKKIVGLVGTNNLSTAIIILGIGVILVFISHPRYLPFIGIGVAGTVFIAIFLGAASYRLERLKIWRNPEAYEKGFQTIQGLYAIGSGGIFGSGLGSSVQKLGFVPEAQNDMIFSIICEETGLCGAVLLIMLFALLIWRLMVIATHAGDLEGALISGGIMGHIAIQVILNIAVVTNTIPNTGITLPFVSYGGTSVVFLLGEMGMALAVSRRGKRESR